MTDESQTPEAPAEEAVENNPTGEINRQRAAFTEMRMKATGMALKGLKALRHLEKVSKGRGTPSLHELTELFASLEAQIQASIEEQQLALQVLTRAFFQGNVQSDAILKMLRDKGVVSEEDFRAAVDTILSEQRAAVAEKDDATIEKSVNQLKGK
jgi:hypothetical protein